MLALGIAAPGSGASAAEQYMTLGLPFFEPYRAAIATLDINGGKVTGTLAAPAGDPRPALPITGTLADGTLKLTVGSGADAYTLSFSEDERGIQQVWDETLAVGDLDRVSFFRPAAGFSSAALAVQHMGDDWCGQVYGGLSVVLRSQSLKSMATPPAALADLDVSATSLSHGAVRAKLKDVWSRLRLAAYDGDDIAIDVAVPVGAEASTAKALRAEPAVAAVTLPNACTEMALAVVPRARISDGGTLSDAKLKSYLEGMLNRLYSGGSAEGGAVGGRKFKLADVSVAKGADGGPVFSARVTAESEASRLARGGWDQFTLSVRPVITATDAADTISLIPAVTDLKTAKKAGAQMPADNAFKPVDDEAMATGIDHRLVSWLAAAENSRCDFLTHAGFDEPEGAYSCSNVSMDDVPHADDN
ncbi:MULTISPECIES: hypothetical protein [unclassified Xanthobacter]|uniref:hypothetical protein n=1 Tax=unclassified Xanthobacter TaxID=2623496 RepID=UPI001F43C288|nr:MULTISPECIES: hypothetical protein [unclassified Xanthobacter]